VVLNFFTDFLAVFGLFFAVFYREGLDLTASADSEFWLSKISIFWYCGASLLALLGLFSDLTPKF
jgi:hypothetical protein